MAAKVGKKIESKKQKGYFMYNYFTILAKSFVVTAKYAIFAATNQFKTTQ